MDVLNERMHALQLGLKEARAGSGAADGSRASAALQQVRDLLDHTTPNPSDSTSLSIRTSLVKVSYIVILQLVLILYPTYQSSRINTSRLSGSPTDRSFRTIILYD